MTHKRSLCILAAGTAALLAVAACTSDGQTGGSASSGPSRLDTIVESGTIRVAVLPDFPPFSVQTASGGFEGYEVDIAQHLAQSLGVQLELVSTDGASRLPLLNANRADVNISSWTSTDERAKAVGYTIPYVADGASVLYRADNPIQSYDDLAGKSVSVTRGSTNDTIMTEDFPNTEIVRFESIADAIEALRAGQVDAAIEGRATVIQEAERDPANYVALAEPPLRPSLISMGVPRGDQEWLNYLNNYIRNLNASGTNAELYRKWFAADLPDLIG
jgi:polar amino acid transport system substrate-binding protein